MASLCSRIAETNSQGVQLDSRHVVVVADCSRADDCDAYGLLSQLEFSIGHGIMDFSKL